MRYEPHISHHLFPMMAITMSSIICFLFPGWQTIVGFLAITIISVMISYWIVITGKVRSEEDYWTQIGQTIHDLKEAEPEIWQALGFINPPERARITVKRTDPQNADSQFYTTQYLNVPVSPAVLQLFANGILGGRKTLSEGSWKGIIAGPTYRSFQDWMEAQKFIAKVNPSAPTQGYILTETGEQWLLQYSSNGVGVEYIRKVPVISDEEVRSRTAAPSR